MNELTHTFTENLFVSCITVNTPGYNITSPLPGLTRRALADTMVELDAMDASYIRLSQLVLQRKIPENADRHDVSVEVEQILWKHGRYLLKKRQTET